MNYFHATHIKLDGTYGDRVTSKDDDEFMPHDYDPLNGTAFYADGMFCHLQEDSSAPTRKCYVCGKEYLVFVYGEFDDEVDGIPINDYYPVFTDHCDSPRCELMGDYYHKHGLIKELGEYFKVHISVPRVGDYDLKYDTDVAILKVISRMIEIVGKIMKKANAQHMGNHVSLIFKMQREGKNLGFLTKKKLESLMENYVDETVSEESSLLSLRQSICAHQAKEYHPFEAKVDAFLKRREWHGKNGYP